MGLFSRYPTGEDADVAYKISRAFFEAATKGVLKEKRGTVDHTPLRKGIQLHVSANLTSYEKEALTVLADDVALGFPGYKAKVVFSKP